MKEPERSAIVTAVRGIATRMQANDTAGVKAATIPAVASHFDGIAASIQKLNPALTGATLSVTSVYDLEATDVPPGEDAVQFFCGVAANDLHVIFNIPGLPAGHFAFAIVEATGVKNPQRLSMLLEKSPKAPGNWRDSFRVRSPVQDTMVSGIGRRPATTTRSGRSGTRTFITRRQSTCCCQPNLSTATTSTS